MSSTQSAPLAKLAERMDFTQIEVRDTATHPVDRVEPSKKNNPR